jgi:hypothetical protein
MDDIAYPDDGEAFESAFALEPACRGLKFYRWNTSTREEKQRVLDTPVWDIQYTHSEFSGRYSYSLWMIPTKFSGLQVSTEVNGAADAARKACMVAKEQGGSR